MIKTWSFLWFCKLCCSLSCICYMFQVCSSSPPGRSGKKLITPQQGTFFGWNHFTCCLLTRIPFAIYWPFLQYFWNVLSISEAMIFKWVLRFPCRKSTASLKLKLGIKWGNCFTNAVLMLNRLEIAKNNWIPWIMEWMLSFKCHRCYTKKISA